jgi:hypothetical protein
MVLEDDDYRRLSGSGQAELGDVVVYRDTQGVVTHVGLVARIVTDLQVGAREMGVLSQWGADGEYFHRVDDVPSLLGIPAEYWSDRK